MEELFFFLLISLHVMQLLLVFILMEIFNNKSSRDELKITVEILFSRKIEANELFSSQNILSS